jgi:hypothetical protein
MECQLPGFLFALVSEKPDDRSAVDEAYVPIPLSQQFLVRGLVYFNVQAPDMIPRPSAQDPHPS